MTDTLNDMSVADLDALITRANATKAAKAAAGVGVRHEFAPEPLTVKTLPDGRRTVWYHVEGACRALSRAKDSFVVEWDFYQSTPAELVVVADRANRLHGMCALDLHPRTKDELLAICLLFAP